METFIPVEKLIKNAQKLKIDLGKGDPYNRLRYYTKIGWIPHMLRKKDDEKGNILGHYPEWVLTRIKQIDDYKNQGLNNDEITKKLALNDKTQKILSNVNGILQIKDAKNWLINYLALALIVFVFLAEMEIIPIGKSKSPIIIQSNPTLPAQIIESGKSYIPKTENKVFIKSSKTQITSNIGVTFETNYNPATRYWISEKIPNEGFFLQLDTNPSTDSHFSWWISN